MSDQMTQPEREEALRLAKEAGFKFGPLYTPMDTQFSTENFVTFYRLARASAVPEDVMRAAERLATPLDPSRVEPGMRTTNQSDIDCAQLILAYLRGASAVPEARWHICPGCAHQFHSAGSVEQTPIPDVLSAPQGEPVASVEWRRGLDEAIAFLERHPQLEAFGYTFADMLRDFADKCVAPSQPDDVRDANERAAWLANWIIDNTTDDQPAWIRLSAEYWRKLSAENDELRTQLAILKSAQPGGSK